MTSDNTDLILRPITPGDMASTATQIHFRQLSGAESLSRRPSASAYTRSSLDLKAEIDDALLDHHSLLYANNRPPRVSRNVRCLRVSAVLGWTLSLALLVALVVSHSTAAPEIPRVDLGSNLRLDTWRQRFAGLKPAHGPESAITFDDDSSAISSSAATNKGEWAAPAPVGSVRSRVTIVSSFYRIDAGKKHRVSGEWVRAQPSVDSETDPWGAQNTTNGSPTSSTLLSYQSSFTVRLRCGLTFKSCAATR